MSYPREILHWIQNNEVASQSGEFFEKVNPVTGEVLANVTRGNRNDAHAVIASASQAYGDWCRTNIITRADILRNAVLLIEKHKDEIAAFVALESGKSKREALAEVGGAIECGFFFAGEGRRYFGQVLTTSVPCRSVKIIRQSIGVGALITPYNNPMAGITWKAFPALLCGNAVVLKSHEYTPYTGIWFAKIFKEAGLPSGSFSVLQGFGPEAGASLVEDPRVKFISFTGSAATGTRILLSTAGRLAKVSIESGGKNPFLVCDDADLKKAAAIAVSAAFVEGGQRCAAASRIIIMRTVYEDFKKLFLEEVSKLGVGIADTDHFGAMISERRMNDVLLSIDEAIRGGAKLLAGGSRIEDDAYRKGYFIQPTVLEGISPDASISCRELFGPVVILYQVDNLDEAIKLANHSDFKLSGAIHTRSINRAAKFIEEYEGGVVRVNGPTQGSEPHMPFGGAGLSGNGWREPGTNAIDFYSEWKQVSIDYDLKEI